MSVEEAQRGSYWSGLKRITCSTSVRPQDEKQGPRHALRENDSSQTVQTVVKRRLLGLWTVQTSVTEVHTSRRGIDSRHSLERLDERVHRRVTARNGRVLCDEMQEHTVVQDHLGRVHSARVATHHHGQLAREVAALYLPAGLAGKAVEGSQPAAAPVGALALGGLLAVAGALGTNGHINGGGGGGRSAHAETNGGFGGAAAAPLQAEEAASVPSRAVGYVYAGGQAVWGVVSDPVALGLPAQRAVSRSSLERSRPPPWQQLPGGQQPPRGKQPHQPQQAQQQQQQQ